MIWSYETGFTNLLSVFSDVRANLVFPEESLEKDQVPGPAVPREVVQVEFIHKGVWLDVVQGCHGNDPSVLGNLGE